MDSDKVIEIPYVIPDKSSYRLMVPFYMPTENGRVWAVALSERSGAVFNAALAILLSLIFSYIWLSIAAVAVWFDGGRRLRRYVGLLSVWNAGEPWTAFKQMGYYAFYCFQRNEDGRGRRDWRDFTYGVSIALVGFIVALGGQAVSIFVPSLIQTGNVAPVNPNVLYYPASQSGDQRILQQFALKVPSVMRALSTATIAREELKKFVHISTPNPQPSSQQGDLSLSFNYDYSLTGMHFGLQHLPALKLEIRGACATEYNWLAESTATNETYFLWNKPTTSVTVQSDESSIRSPPIGSFVLHPNATDQVLTTGNISYGIVIGSANRPSLNAGEDPWYATELRPPNATKAEHNANYWIKRRRPVLSCWEQRTWEYRGNRSTNFSALNRTTTPDLSRPLLTVLRTALGRPMVVTVGIHAGDSALLCRTTSSRGVVDGARCNIYTDMERLILASFVATQHVFTDSTLFQDEGDYPNVYKPAEATKVLDGSDGFVLYTTNVQTFSMIGIIVIAVCLLTFFVGRFIAVRLVGRLLDKRNIWSEMELLGSPAHLFRNLYESNAGKHEEYWPCDSRFPTGDDDRKFELLACGHGKEECYGHIDTKANGGSGEGVEGGPLLMATAAQQGGSKAGVDAVVRPVNGDGDEHSADQDPEKPVSSP
ncbi:hypothetical protein QBC43DRAFT_268693 [Cladorrhinum sp. PSN259]|nr:hypothetical protein QBC43DRAFT_268693 [Cladorrhinum sp. PSN259]